MKELAPTIVTSPQADLIAATIASGQSLSAGIDLGYQRVVRIVTPAAWTAADLTFQTSTEGVTYGNLFDAQGNEYTVKAAAARAIIIPVADLIGVRFIKIRSGTSTVAVNQAAARSLEIVVQ